jgi:Na+-transporting NADH:ubiquinone oxidoreductase subunit NqrB
MEHQSKKTGISFLSGIFFGSGILSIIFGLYYAYDLSVNGNNTSKYLYYLLTGVCCIFVSRQISPKQIAKS